MSTGAQVIVSELERAGVEVCFGLPGVHNLALWAALRSPIRLVGVRHEQAAAYAADGYARATGGLGVALTTTGPGAANTLGAVGEAWASRSPILVIATESRRPAPAGEYRGILHETAGQAGMFAPVVKSVHLGLSADAVGRRGGRGPRALAAPAPGLPGDRDRPAGRRGRPRAPHAAASRPARSARAARRPAPPSTSRPPSALDARRASAAVGGRRRA